jgi:PAS domain S-box-containing protein
MPFSKFFNPLMNLSSDLFFVCDEEGTLFQVNLAVKEHFDLIEPTTANKLPNLIHPDDVDKFREYFTATIHQNQTQNRTFRLKTKSGSYEFFEFHQKCVRDENYFGFCARSIDQEHRLRSILAQTESVTRVGTWEIDMATKALYWSPRTYEIHGKDPKGYRPVLEDGLSFYHPDHIAIITEAVEKLMTTGKGYDLKLKFIDAQGKHLWVRAISQAEMKDGKVARIYGSFEDITEERLKQIESENLNTQLRSVSDRLAIAIEGLGFGVWDWNLLTNQLVWDEHMYKLFQIRKQDFTSDYQAFEKTLLPEDALKVRKDLNALFASKGKKFETEFRIKNQFDEIRYIKASAICFYDDSARPCRLVGTNWDITSERKAQESLRLLRQEMDTFFKSASEPMFIADFADYFLRVNPAMIRCLGYSEGELLSAPFLTWVHPDDRDRTIKALSVLKKGESLNGFENRYMTKTGDYRIFNWAAVPDLENKSIYSSIRDVTEVRKAELKMVESARLASLGEMAGGIAHEINNPLAIIRGKAEQIASRRNDPEYLKNKLKSDLDKISQTVERITSIIRGLRTFARDSSQDPFVRSNVQTVINDSMDMCAERLRAKNIEFKTYGDFNWEIWARPIQLTQVLVNLINNSMDAIEKQSEKWIHLEVENSSGTLKFSVTDSGSGIPKDVRSRLMEPFFTTKAPGKGTGLGLSISKGIIEDHNGKFYYDDSCKNTRFVFELPAFESVKKVS